MKKINYTDGIKEKYSNLILKHKNLEEITNLQVDYNIGRTFEELLVLPIEELINVSKIGIEEIKKKNHELDNKELKKEKERIEKLFNYKGLQEKLSRFFMQELSKSRTCYYCNLDFINTFINFENEYKDKFDLINNHKSEKELQLIEGITEKRANKITEFKGKIATEDDFNKSTLHKVIKNILNSLFNYDGTICYDKIKTHNHFTLDHVLPQKDYPHLSLSLYNLVPCCSSCNSKFKKENKLHESISELKGISPTSDDFDLDILTSFDILFNDKYDSINLPNSADEYKIKLNSKYEKYIETLKIQGRYNFHKEISFDLIKKRKMYSDSQLEEIEKIFFDNNIYIDKETLKKQIFGSVIFEKEDTNEPFEKYKKDIAKQLGLI